jgi:hypothetical protein
MDEREAAGAVPALRLAAGIALAMAAAGFWGWIAESLRVAGLTLVTALGAAALEGRRPSGSLAAACLLPFGLGALWTAVERVLERLGAGGWGGLAAP